MGSYLITEVLNDVAGKFSCKVSYNGGASERFESESLSADLIDAELQKSADDAESLTASKDSKEQEVATISVADGKIVKG